MATLEEQGKSFTPDDLREMALQVAEHYQVPRDLMLGLAANESEWNPNAKNPKSSALGLGQFLDGTAPGYFQGLGALDGGPDDPRRHPGYSLDAMARYLRDLHKENNGDWEAAVKHYGEDTDAYLGKVKAAAGREADEYHHFQQGKFFSQAAQVGEAIGDLPQYPEMAAGVEAEGAAAGGYNALWDKPERLNRSMNMNWAKPGPYYTTLSPEEEQGFQQWLKQNKVPFDLNEQYPDYDMRGFYKGLQTGDSHAQTGIDDIRQRAKTAAAPEPDMEDAFIAIVQQARNGQAAADAAAPQVAA